MEPVERDSLRARDSQEVGRLLSCTDSSPVAMFYPCNALQSVEHCLGGPARVCAAAYGILDCKLLIK